MKEDSPLVSIMIPNRNHSMFLDGCIQGALDQTYDNIEIIFLDNCSTDNSIEVASRYAHRGVRVCKNPLNITNRSIDLLAYMAKGKYLMTLFADDLIKPTMVEKCVSIMEAHPEVGYVHCERDFIDADGTITELDPFYNCSFISPGRSALPIYLLADVAQSPQCLMRRTVFDAAMGFESEFDHVNADKDLWFRLSLISDYAYIREKLSLIRVHASRETIKAFRNFYHPLALFLTIDFHVRLGSEQELHNNVVERKAFAFHKLALEFLNIASFALNENNRDLAKQYLLFAQITSPDIIHENLYTYCFEAYNGTREDATADLSRTGQDMYKKRTRSYEPPEGYRSIKLEDYGN